ncbi:acetyl/propionyl/methylcrotonyl-CoA carboxylase subunit alpha [Methylocystis sp. JAN1]|uniref:acetyl/propionyl/methylcrotonyl-CoA carboxylase subunit alpha n=1 Tax=Methylocystis sp. JAN1 TaxID=3397211 RepID=UPI003FA1FF0B
MFRKVLIANRGEIACRIARTARRLGIATVAVFSDADAFASHVEMADEAWRLGEAPARDSYLSIDKVIDVARRSGAEAVHPGYGFLAESAAFAESCARAGLVFIGPSPGSMRMVGDKAAAKRLMNEIGVPSLPGFHGDAQDARVFARVARDIGYPVVVKASAGGGGRGMRVVQAEDELRDAMESAAREAKAAFGDGRLLLEKFVDRPRHVEIQFFRDRSRNVVTFAERDCSLQRRRQKVIEESPGPRISQEVRAALREATTRIAHAADYLGAGTAEFLLDRDTFHFLEVNARLQVEHPVTEMIAGVDLVEWQFRVAYGESLPKRQDEIVCRGWAIEARVCAEDATQGFRPSSGVITHLRLPSERAGLRLEVGVREGDAVSSHYDSLLAKIVVWNEERDGAIRLLARALDEVELVGVASNLDFLRALLCNDAFLAGRADTGVAQIVSDAFQSIVPEDEMLLLAAAVTGWRERESASAAGDDPLSPWAVPDAWRLYGRAAQKIAFRYEGRLLECDIAPIDAHRFEMTTGRGVSVVAAKRAGDRLALFVDDRRREVGLAPSASGWVVIVDGHNHFLEWVETLTPPPSPAALERPFTAPLPARVAKVLVKRGDHIEKGAALILLEAMKMEIPINAPHEGVIKDVYCGEGQSVREGEELLAWRSTHDIA